MKEDIGKILKKTEKRIEERLKEEKYEQRYLKDLEINEPVNVSDDAFPEASTIRAKDIKAGETAFWGAVYCEAGKVEAERAFDQAIYCRAKEVKADVAFAKAKNCRAEKVNADTSAFYLAENCKAGEVGAATAFTNAVNCQADKVKALSAFDEAKSCRANKVYVKFDAFEKAKKCLVGDEIEAKKIMQGKKSKANIGNFSRGVVILGKTEGEVFPSVILMKDKIKDDPAKVKEFFEKEMEKDEKRENNIFESNIFDGLSYFNWEGKTLEEGKEKLKERYDRFINNLFNRFKDENYFASVSMPEIKFKKNFYLMLDDTLRKEGLKDTYFYYLVDDNSKRQEIFEGFHNLRKREENSLTALNDHLPKFKEIKEGLGLLSLKDWVKLADLAEFLGFDNKRIDNIKQEVEKVELGKIVENPDGFTAWKTAKKIKQFEHLKKRFNTQQLMEEFGKEKESKINSGIKEYILKSPEENLNGYLETLGWKGEKNEDIVFAARLHKVLTNKGERKNAEVLEKLMKGKKPIEFEENKLWLDKMEKEKKFDTKKWLAGKQKDYPTIAEKDYSASLEKNRRQQVEEIVNHFKEIGIKIAPELQEGDETSSHLPPHFVQEIERILSEKEKELPPNVKKDIKTHIQAYRSLSGIEKSDLPKKIFLKTEENPLKAIQMGELVTGSCLAIRGGYEQSAVPNAADINKKIVWAKDEKGNILGRVLLAINENGNLEHFKVFNNDPRLNLESNYKNFISEFAGDLKIKLASKEDIEESEVKELVGENWHNDGAVEF